MFDEFSAYNRNNIGYGDVVKYKVNDEEEPDADIKEERAALPDEETLEKSTEKRYNKSQQGKTKNGELKNEQENRNSGVLERGVVSAASGSKDIIRQQSNDPSKIHRALATNAQNVSKSKSSNGSHYKTSESWIVQPKFFTRGSWERFEESVLRNRTKIIADIDTKGRRISQIIKNKFIE